MDLKTYWRALDAAAKRDFAEKCNVQPIYIFQIVSGHGRPSPTLAWRMQKHSRGVLRVDTLRPDIEFFARRSTSKDTAKSVRRQRKGPAPAPVAT